MSEIPEQLGDIHKALGLLSSSVSKLEDSLGGLLPRLCFISKPDTPSDKEDEKGILESELAALICQLSDRIKAVTTDVNLRSESLQI